MSVCLIHVNQLHNGKPNQYKLVDIAEECMALWLNTLTNLSPIIEVSTGYNPKWDFTHKDGTTSELKICSSKVIQLEVSKSDGSLSGLSATKSDFHIIVHRGWNGILKQKVGKVRFIPTPVLKQYIAEHKERLTPIIREGDTISQSSICYPLDVWSLTYDGWVGDVPISEDSHGEVSYDFTIENIIRLNYNFTKTLS